uniref:Prosaposin n=1 Tax=Anser brachyrhynchus TaxID=132585 RepID=A0A8B9ICH7_9AVES
QVACLNTPVGSGCHSSILMCPLPQQKGIPCHLCQVVVSTLGKILQDNCTEEKLRLFLDKKCQYLPFQDWSVKCKKMVDTGILILVQLAKGEVSDPKVVCGTIKLCQPRGSPEGALKFQEPPPAPAQDFAELTIPVIAGVPLLLQPQDTPRAQPGDLCGDCARLVAAVQMELGAFARSVASRAEKECEGLAPVLAQRVTSLCRGHKAARLGGVVFTCWSPTGYVGLVPSPAILKILKAGWGELSPCIFFFFNLLPQETTPLCEMCEFAVRAAESLLENNMTEEQLVNDIEKVCYMLPHGVIGQCKDFVDSYGKAVVIMLLEATDPRAICTMLRLCPRRGAARGVAAALEPATGSFCNVCQILITYFDNELLKNETLAELGDVLEKGCELLPAPLTGQCEALVVQYEPAAVRLLVQMMDPDFVCTKIRACDSPLGSEPCAWGPGYWCASMATAIECDAVEHCRRHIWD